MSTKRTGFGRDGEKQVELCLGAGQSFYNLALFSVDMYFRENITLNKSKFRDGIYSRYGWQPTKTHSNVNGVRI